MRVAIVVLISLLTLYAPLELSRLIFAYGLAFDTTFELCIIWTFYLAAMGILAKVVKV